MVIRVVIPTINEAIVRLAVVGQVGQTEHVEQDAVTRHDILLFLKIQSVPGILSLERILFGQTGSQFVNQTKNLLVVDLCTLSILQKRMRHAWGKVEHLFHAFSYNKVVVFSVAKLRRIREKTGNKPFFKSDNKCRIAGLSVQNRTFRTKTGKNLAVSRIFLIFAAPLS